jgi:hypothetical protein
MSLNTLLMSDEMIKERSGVHGNLDAKLIYPDIKIAQDMYIMPILGTALYNKLLTAINANDWTGLDNYKSLLDVYIVDALMNYTLAEMPLSSFQFWNKGLLRKIGLDTEVPSMSDMIDIANRYRTRGEFYANRLRLYLIQNAYLSFPEYLQPGTGIDTVNPANKGFSTSIYLGEDNDCCNNPGGFTRKPYT